MKKYAMWTMVGLMWMAPAAFAEDTTHSANEKTADGTTAKKTTNKKMAKANRKVKPLTAQEQKELANIRDSSKEPNATGEDRSEVK